MAKRKVSKLEITTLPEYAFLKGVAKRDVVKLRLLSRQEKKDRKWGEPDVECVSLWYKLANQMTKGTAKEYITRKQASSMFYNMEPDKKGQIRKFDARVLSSNKAKYVTSELSNIPVVVLEPSTSKYVVYTLKGKELPKKAYVVFALDENKKILFDFPVILEPKFFVSMIELKETSVELKDRIMRYRTATEDRKEAQYRVVANIVDRNTYKHLGYMLSYIDEKGKNRESMFTMKQIEQLLESNNIRNMRYSTGMHGSKELELTYGRLIELPTHFYVSKKK